MSSADTRERIGFLGLGIMGSRMAARIAEAGFPLTVWTHTPGKAAAWVAEQGSGSVVAADTPAEVARASEIVVSMVVNGAQVESVLLGEGGVVEATGTDATGTDAAGTDATGTDVAGADATGTDAAGTEPGLLCVDMLTIAPADSRRIAAGLAERGVRMLDAPVTGSSPRAQAGTLTIMAGGEAADFARARPIFEAMGEVIVHVGELGQGEMLKLINNSLGAANAAALAEALLVARATGVDLDAFVQVTSAGSGASAQLTLKSSPMREHDYETLFKTEHMLKDVRLCLEEAQAAGVPFPAAAHARDLLTATLGRGHGADDYAAMIEAAEGFAGRRL